MLDLEALASHRGSVLGRLPGRPQPSQKAFETALWNALRHFDAQRPVFVEAESKKVGNLRVPETLIRRMREHGRCLNVEMPDSGRLAPLLQEYDFFVRDGRRQLDALLTLRGRETVHAWQAAGRAGRIAEVFLELMHRHYDPGYLKSMKANFAGFADARVVAHRLADGEAATLKRAAAGLLSTATDV